MMALVDVEVKVTSTSYPEIHIGLEVNDFFGAVAHDVKNRWYCKFYFLDVQWTFEFNHHFGIKVYCCTMPPECQIDCLIGIMNSDGSTFKIYRNLKKAPYDLTPPYLFSINKNEILTHRGLISIDGALTIFCNMRCMNVINARSTTPSLGHMQEVSCQTLLLESIETLSKDFEQLLATGHLADMTFKVEGREFRAHKSILAARSRVLESMCTHEMLESSTGVVNITDCDENVFHDFLMFLYSGRLENIPSSNIATLYEIADKYDLQTLREECVKRMTIDISVDLVCDILHVVAIYDEKQLLKTATDFFMENAKLILATNQWKMFLKQHTELGSELVLKYVNK